MEQISSLLHFDVAKYKDIFNILHKLEEDGAINEISNLFYKIFSSESKFALGELVKIQKERSESKMDLGRQFESNLSLFKSNFYLIVQLLLENTFKVVVKENQEKVKDKSISLDNSEGFIPTIEDTQTPRQREKALTRKPDSPSNKSKKSTSEKNNQSNETKKSKVNKNTNSSSVLKGMVNKDNVAKTTRESKDQDRENSLTQSQQLSGPLKKRDSKPLISPIQIPSEFNKVQGPASFSQSERKFMEINRTSPGPAFYDVNQSSPLHLKRSTSPTIGKAKKRTWVDIATKTASPGPGGLYPSHHFISK